MVCQPVRCCIVVYDSLSKVFLNADYAPGKLAVSLQGQPDIDLSLMPGRGREDVTVNGKPSPGAEPQRNGLVRLSLRQ